MFICVLSVVSGKGGLQEVVKKDTNSQTEISASGIGCSAVDANACSSLGHTKTAHVRMCLDY